MRALSLLILVSWMGCGLRVEDDPGADGVDSAAAVDGGESDTGTASTDTGAAAIDAGSTDPGAAKFSGGPTSFSLDVSNCIVRPFAVTPGGLATAIVANWFAERVANCGGAPSTCGDVTIHFSRLPQPACADQLTFSVAPPRAFVACLANEIAASRLAAGNFVDGDQLTLALCR